MKPLITAVFPARGSEEAFRAAIGNRAEQMMEVEYVYQRLEDLPAGYQLPAGRVKPWAYLISLASSQPAG